MANAHRTNVLVTSCLKTPVDPQTKAPLASYERERVLPYTATPHMDNREYEKELEYEDSGSDFCDEDCLGKGGPLLLNDYRAAGDHLDLSNIFFSNEEYYSKLEELKKAHLRTMAELESMYRRKLELKCMEPLDMATLETGHRLLWSNTSPAAARRLRKSHSAVELRRSSGQSDLSYEDEAANNDVEKGLLFSPKEHIKNMWRDFKVSPHNRHLSSCSLHSLPGDQKRPGKGKGKKRQGLKVGEQSWKHRVTVPKPFHMTVREAERRKRGVKTRSEMEVENAELRRQLEGLTECQRKFRASPVPAHVHLPLYEELQEQYHERRQNMRDREEQHLRTVQKPFSFLERERLKKEQKQLRHPQPSDQEKVKPFKAKPVPKAVYAAASGEQMKEERLYRSIKTQMRAQELLHSASMPPSMLARRLSDRKKTKDDAAGGGDNSFTHRPQINKEIPDFNASYQRFQKQLEKRKEVKPTTACEPFDLRTSQISSHRDRILADIEKEQSPRMLRWPYINSGAARTPNSSLCSSLSGSLEVLPAKVTDATKRRHEAVRKALEQRKKAEEEEERRRERQKQREKKLQRVVLKRAQANDPHLALSQTHQTKLKEFRKQEQQRRKEYQQEMKEMQQRVKGRPLLLEQVAQRNAKQAAEKRYTDALQGYSLTEEFISGKAVKSGSASQHGDGKQSDLEDLDMGYLPVHYRKVFLDDDDDEDVDDPDERERGREDEESDEASFNQRYGEDPGGQRSDEDDRGDDRDHHYSDESYHYSDDHEEYSEDSEHDADTKQEAGE
ncbi:protein FAM161A [Seriola lalandi dorsalis]|uniref:protein FAM161A n=1 Tax=Seriola lalandi dorsalis TaxID=1841481 RepID=UPI000C6F7B43|nr:protein FAM161A [Seriola lalandi dorsalis]